MRDYVSQLHSSKYFPIVICLNFLGKLIQFPNLVPKFGIAKSVWRWVMGWMTKEVRLDSKQEQDIILSFTPSRPDLGPTQALAR
jgi:hypothetical protein